MKKCFLFQVIHGKHPDKDPRMQVSNDFRIVTWNWVRISKTLMENWFTKLLTQDLAKQKLIARD